jgi:hypothetical protein
MVQSISKKQLEKITQYNRMSVFWSLLSFAAVDVGVDLAAVLDALPIEQQSYRSGKEVLF